MNSKVSFALGAVGILGAVLTALFIGTVLQPHVPEAKPQPVVPTVENAQCNVTRLTFDIVNENGFGVNVSVDYGPAWSGWGDFWVPRNTTSGFVIDQGVSCAGALPLTVQGWGIAEQCPWPPELGRCGQ